MQRLAHAFARLALLGLALTPVLHGAIKIVSDANLFFSRFSGNTGLVGSNMVEVDVQQLNFQLTNDHSIDSTPGAPVVFPHHVINNGDDTVDISVGATNLSGSGTGLSDITIVIDANNNGRIDPNELPMAPSDTIKMKPGEERAVLVHGLVPSDAGNGANAVVVVNASIPSIGASAYRFNRVRTVRPTGTAFFVEKTVSRPEAEIGETVAYTIQVRNNAGLSISNLEVFDQFPEGFLYERGSLQIAGQSRPDPKVRDGEYVIPVDPLEDKASVTLTYRARVGPTAVRGDGINQARAAAIAGASNIAVARTNVRSGAFTDRGVLLGRVYFDLNHNGVPDAGEPGLPNARIYMEDGTSVLTDTEGKYSFYGLSAHTHVLKLDATSLPAGAQLADISSTRFVEMKRYELHRADFALDGTADALAEVKSRRELLRGSIEVERELKGRLTTDGQPIAVSDRKALPSSGVITTPVGMQSVSPDEIATKSPNAFNFKVTLPSAAAAPAKLAVSDDTLLLSVRDNTLGFVGLKNGDVLAAAQTEIIVKGPLGAQFTLAVNGALYGAERVGTKATLPDQQAEMWKFIGLDLTPGDNRLRVNLVDAFGNARGSETINVRAPGELATLKITASDAIADGITQQPVIIELLDARGTPVAARTAVTLQANRGRWLTEDLDPLAPGLQVFIEGGKKSLFIEPPLEPGECTVTATSGTKHDEASFSFKPNLRPMIAVGVLEGALHFGSQARGAIFATSNRDAFEEELRGLSASSNDGRLGAGARAAFFLKGKVRGDFLLTASFDSDKPSDERLFRDIQPGEYYPVYGDGSVRGYDAQSTGKLYVRLDRNRCYALIGDFTTATSPSDQSTDFRGAADLRALGNYQRSLTGTKEHFENDRVRANVWASQDSTRQAIVELPANGTSGPFEFGLANALANSERVEIITRDRNQPSRIIAVKAAVRFFDYEFEPFTGRLLFNAPVASLDADLNPISIRITCEVDQGGEKFWVYGGDARVKLGNRLEVGGGYVRDENPQAAYELGSVGATFKIAAKTTVTAEAAQSRSAIDNLGTGNAGRVELQHTTEKTDANIYLGKTATNFRNPGALLLPGRIEGGFKLTEKLMPTLSLIGQGVYSEDVATGGRLVGVRGDLEKAFGAYKVAVGARHSEETVAPVNGAASPSTPNTVDSLRVRLTAPLPNIDRASAYTEYEQDINSSDQRMAAVGFDYVMKSGGRFYARHEFISTLTGPFELNDQQRNRTTLVGFERGFLGHGRIFNEYRASNELTGREAEAALGVRDSWRLAEGVNTSASFEKVNPIRGLARNESTAITGAIDYARNPLWRANSRLEFRTSPTANSALHALGYARQLDYDWTFLAKSIALLTRFKGTNQGDTLQSRIQTGFAWRPANNPRWNALGKYEFKYESDDRLNAPTPRRTAHVVTGDVNYQPSKELSISAHYAGKWVNETTATASNDFYAHLMAARVSRQLGRRFEVALNGSIITDGDFSQFLFAVGPEIGVNFGQNFSVGLGYNFTGFRDRDLAPDRTTAQGVYLRLRMKFDETFLASSEQPPKGT